MSTKLVVSPANQLSWEYTDCITYLVVFGSANGLLPTKHQAITLIKAGVF